MTGGECELWHSREAVRNRRPQQVVARYVQRKGASWKVVSVPGPLTLNLSVLPVTVFVTVADANPAKCCVVEPLGPGTPGIVPSPTGAAPKDTSRAAAMAPARTQRSDFGTCVRRETERTQLSPLRPGDTRLIEHRAKQFAGADCHLSGKSSGLTSSVRAVPPATGWRVIVKFCQ
jgi:hypothetical protein